MTPHPSNESEERDCRASSSSSPLVGYLSVQRQQHQAAAPYVGPDATPSRVAVWPMRSALSPSQQQERYERQYRQELLVCGKRLRSPVDRADDHVLQQHQDDVWRQEAPAPAAAVSSGKKQQRRPSHVIKQEAKQLLTEQLRHLELQKLLLQQEKGVVDPTPSQGVLEHNAKLREILLHQSLVIATTQSAFSGFASSETSSPLETSIYLGEHQGQRRRALLAMRGRKLDVALRFLNERTRHMSPLKKSYEVSQFESAEGDIRMIRLDVTPIDGATSVRQVYDALQSCLVSSDDSVVVYTANDNEYPKPAVLQHRRVMTEKCGALAEQNSVFFLDSSGLNSRNADEQCAVITQDAVDRDDLYPYCPADRLRKDTTGVMKLSAHWRSWPGTPEPRSGSAEPDEAEGEEELVVVLTRWTQLRLRRAPEVLRVSSRALQRVADDMLQGLESMIEGIREQVRTP